MIRTSLAACLIVCAFLASPSYGEENNAGKVLFGEKVFELEHVLAYVRGDSVVVALSSHPFDEAEIVRELEKGSRSPIDPIMEKLLLRFDEDGEIEWVQFFFDGVSHNGSPSDVESRTEVSGGRISGSAVMTAEEELSGRSFRFEASFDAKVLRPGGTF